MSVRARVFISERRCWLKPGYLSYKVCRLGPFLFLKVCCSGYGLYFWRTFSVRDKLFILRSVSVSARLFVLESVSATPGYLFWKIWRLGARVFILRSRSVSARYLFWKIFQLGLVYLFWYAVVYGFPGTYKASEGSCINVYTRHYNNILLSVNSSSENAINSHMQRTEDLYNPYELSGS